MGLALCEWTVFELKNMTVLTKPFHQIYMSLGAAAAADKLDKYEARTGPMQWNKQLWKFMVHFPCTMH